MNATPTNFTLIVPLPPRSHSAGTPFHPCRVDRMPPAAAADFENIPPAQQKGWCSNIERFLNHTLLRIPVADSKTSGFMLGILLLMTNRRQRLSNFTWTSNKHALTDTRTVSERWIAARTRTQSPSATAQGGKTPILNWPSTMDNPTLTTIFLCYAIGRTQASWGHNISGRIQRRSQCGGRSWCTCRFDGERRSTLRPARRCVTNHFLVSWLRRIRIILGRWLGVW